LNPVGYFCAANLQYLKRFLLISLYLSIAFAGLSQNDTPVAPQRDTPVKKLQVRPVQKPVIRVSPRLTADSIRRLDSLRSAGLLSDSLMKDTLIMETDTVKRKPEAVKVQKFSGIDSTYAHFLQNPYFPTNGKPVYQILKFRERDSKDEMFYIVAGLVLFLAFIKLLFSRYFKNIFRLLFQPSFRQKQTREQLMQNSLPSLMLNLFFLVSGGAYIALLIRYYNFLPLNFWLLFLYSTVVLGILYMGKFLFLSFSGWVFNVKEASDTYMFTVYLINKITGVLLLPFILILAFSQTQIIDVAVTVSALLIILLFLYRYAVSYAPVRREVKVSPLHFIIYVLAFEIVPLLLIYKTLMLYLARTL
jgi:hypothetical protein